MVKTVILHDLIDSLNNGKVWEPSFKHTLDKNLKPQSDWFLSIAPDAVCYHAGTMDEITEAENVPELLFFPHSVTWVEGVLRDGVLGVLAARVGPASFNVAVFNKREGIAWQLVCVLEMVEGGDNNDWLCNGVAACEKKRKDRIKSYKYGVKGIRTALNFFALLIENGGRLVQHPAPEEINREREKKGKCPIFTFFSM